jgi:hypothetical protein
MNSMHPRKTHNFHFAIPINGHTTRVIFRDDSSAPMPYLHNLVHGLILSPGQEVLNDLSLDDVSILTFFRPQEDFMKPVSPQLMQTVKPFLMNNQCPKSKYLILVNMVFDGFIEDLISISQQKMSLIYLLHCGFKTLDPIWLALSGFMLAMNSMHPVKILGFQFAIPIDRHITQIVFAQASSFLMPNSPELFQGLILRLGHDLPNDLSFNDISFLIFLPSEANLSNQQLCSHSKQSPNPIKCDQCSKLKYLFLKDVSLDDVKKGFDFGRQLELKVFNL